MNITDLKNDLVVSLKKGEHVRVETLRFLLAAIRNTAIEKYGAASEVSLTDTDIIDVVKKQVKTHKESIMAFQNVSRQDLVDKEQAQLTILQGFLPAEMTDDELKKLLEPVVSSGETHLPAGRQDFGKLMGQAMGLVKGKVDGGRVSAMLKEMLQHRQ